MYQPLVAGLERAGRTRTAPSAPSAAEGWKYYYAAQAIIFCRPRGAEPRTDDQMLQLARRVAASADSFIAEWELKRREKEEVATTARDGAMRGARSS